MVLGLNFLPFSNHTIKLSDYDETFFIYSLKPKVIRLKLQSVIFGQFSNVNNWCIPNLYTRYSSYKSNRFITVVGGEKATSVYRFPIDSGSQGV